MARKSHEEKLTDVKLLTADDHPLMGLAHRRDPSEDRLKAALAFGEKHKTTFFSSIRETLRNAKGRWL